MLGNNSVKNPEATELNFGFHIIIVIIIIHFPSIWVCLKMGYPANGHLVENDDRPWDFRIPRIPYFQSRPFVCFL